MEVSHNIYSCQKFGYPILGGRGRFWEGRRCLKWGYILGQRVGSVSVTYRCLEGGGIFGERGLDYVSVAYSGSEGGIFWRDG